MLVISSLFHIYGMKKFYIENKYVFYTYFSIYGTSKRYIVNAISIFNNQQSLKQSMNHKDMKIIQIKLFVNNVACFTAYLANAKLFMISIKY